MDVSPLGVLVAFVAGIISFLSPCVLPLVPGYVSYIAGGSLKEFSDYPSSRRRLKSIYLSLCFVFEAGSLPVNCNCSIKYSCDV